MAESLDRLVCVISSVRPAGRSRQFLSIKVQRRTLFWDGLMWVVALFVFGGFLLMLFDLMRGGASAVTVEFLTESPRLSGRAGGIFPILVATFGIVGIATLVAPPIALGAALFLFSQVREKSGYGVILGATLDTLAATPSIVFGLFGHVLFCEIFGFGYSILSGGLTLAAMVLPLLVRAVEQALRTIPLTTRMAASGLGLSQTTALIHVFLPAARRSLAAAWVLGLGRAFAETAALIFTSGYVARMPHSVFDSARSLSIHVLDLAMNVPGGDKNAAASALVLAGILGILSWVVLRLDDSLNHGTVRA